MNLKDIPITDTHFHVWNTDELSLPWLSLFEGRLKSHYSFDDYLDATKNINIQNSCYVEVDTIKTQHKKEAESALELCKAYANQVKAVTLGCDLSDEAYGAYIEHYATNALVKAMRHNFFTTDPKLAQEKTYIENTQLLGKMGIMSDLVMAVESMPYGIELTQRCPNTTFIIDHCGVCPLNADSKTQQLWLEGIQAYAEQNNTICKLSECTFTSTTGEWCIADVKDIINHCVKCFGEDRLIYASNWPVCELTGSIAQWLEALQTSLPTKTEKFWHKLLHVNAGRYYQFG